MINKKSLLIDYIPAVFAAVFIITFAVLKEQTFIKTLPTLITLVVQLLMVRANRYAFLLGGLNSILYAYSAYTETLYFQMFSAIAVSMTIQIYSYFSWKKNSSEKDPELRMLPNAKRVMIVLGVLALWIFFWKTLGEIAELGEYVALDSLIFVIGIAATALSAGRFVDSQYFSLVSSVLSLILSIMIAVRRPSYTNYVIISIYNVFRITEIMVEWSRRCKKCEIST